jgi:hypothetical protein
MNSARILILLIFINCNPYPIPNSILEEIYPDINLKNGAYPKILLEKKVQLNESHDIEKIFLIQRENEEVFVCLEGDHLSWYLTFTLMDYISHEYDQAIRGWKAKKNHGREPIILSDISFHKLAKDNFYSIFFTVFSEEPPINAFKVPMVIRAGRIVFNGIHLLKEEKVLMDWKNLAYQYEEQSGIIQIISPDGTGKSYKWINERFVE